MVFHNGSAYHYHFIIKELAKKCEGQFEYFVENTVPIKKVLGNSKSIKYKLMCIDSFRFMSTLLSNLVDNLFGMYSKDCKGFKERKKIKSVCEFIGLKNN